jgi:hypothetical protein
MKPIFTKENFKAVIFNKEWWKLYLSMMSFFIAGVLLATISIYYQLEDSYNFELNKAIEAERQEHMADVGDMWRSFQPDEGCSLIIVDPHSKWMVCEGEPLYERIHEEWPYD